MGKNNHYLEEEELKAELILVQKTERLKTLLKQEELTEEEEYEKYSLIADNINPNYKRTKFGEMLLLLINRIITQPKFSSYSYRDEFISNAIEKVFLYGIKNFDVDRVSKVNGKPVKAFAYLTQIINNAIIATINAKKTEKEMLDSYFTELKESEINLRGSQSYALKDYENEFAEQTKIFVRFFVSTEESQYLILNQFTKEDIKIVYKEEKPLIESMEALIFVSDNKEDNKFKVEEARLIKILPCNTLEEIVDDILSFNEKSRLYLDILYPDIYILKTRELDEILKHNIPSLNIVKFYEKYIPQFPFQKKKKEKELNLWVQ